MLSDHTSLSNFSEIVVTHSTYELDVDFDRKVIDGYVKLEARPQVASPTHLVLDTRELTIHGVELLGQDGAKGQALAHEFGEKHEVLGTPLRIPLPPGLQPGGAPLNVGIRFTTSPSSSAVQWLAPEQTAGGKQPYLFTQCQAIHARSLVPCQDSPGAKMSYSAAVRVPGALTALMSAVPVDDGAAGVEHLSDVQPAGPTRVFHFTQKVPIPPYLLALAVGELESRELSPRSRVWSEPSMVEAGAHEFAETAKFLDAGEAVAGDYVWGRYDLLLLPPSFPYGGMENPCLTFVTPTLLAGDRSLTNVIAHEIAHSWTGNLVTNASWEHFWCNEGFTVFLERKILGHLHGQPTLQFHAAHGALTLQNEVQRLGESHAYTCLVPDLSGGVDPDDVFSSIPYEKGFYFLYYLQELVGGAERFDPFLKAYIQHFAFKAITTQDFKDFFLQHFADTEAVKQIDWETWLHGPGMPPVTNAYDTSLAQQATELAKKWHTADVMGIGSQGPAGASSEDIAGWSSDQIITFLEKLGEFRAMQPLHKSITRKLASLYNLYSYKNAEIRCAWYKLAIPAEDEEVLPHCTDFIKIQGRMKFLRPVYRALFKSKMGKEVAVATFQECKASYHPIAQKMVGADLGMRA